ncbi:unnamed protein product [Anisakis simplex]|uniref:Uncharacterized protein n=1 Tax=Anisakis simplex TaxID=6269 RepID=A0A0M3KJL8_ANISI|nr:unnamed protein product [Anisakis simplex]
MYFEAISKNIHRLGLFTVWTSLEARLSLGLLTRYLLQPKREERDLCSSDPISVETGRNEHRSLKNDN